jgi:formylglycine-generating enzyme
LQQANKKNSKEEDMRISKVLLFVLMTLISLTGCMGKESEKEESVELISKKTKTVGTLYFRGTSNGWGKSEMIIDENGLWKTTALFDGKGNPDRFKIDISGNWKEAYPTQDFKIKDGIGSYLILFNYTTKEITAEKLPKLKTKTIQLTALQNDDTFKLPETGQYIKEDGTSESVNLTWTPAIDVTTVGTKEYIAEYEGYKTTIMVKVKNPAVKESNYPNGVYFRGTENSWKKTVMVLKDDYLWETFILFDGKGSPDRFKIDVSGNWRESYPAKDYLITEGAGEYTITFNEVTKEVKAVKGTNNKVILTQESAIIEKSDIEFKLPKFGTYTNADGVSKRVMLTNWIPELDKTKEGTTIYYSITANGAIAKFDLTVKEYTKYPNGVYFRGTSNLWNKTEMESVGNYLRQTVQKFQGNSLRFKIDVSGNWRTTYPSRDFIITEGPGTYNITFNEKTKEIKVLKIIQNDMIEVKQGKAIIKFQDFSYNLKFERKFYISKFEVTQSEFIEIMGFNPSYCVGDSGNNPVENITYYDAVIYCNRLSERDGLQSYYNITDIKYGDENSKKRATNAFVTQNIIANGYRLPTFKEWIYAANGGEKSMATSYSGSNVLDETGWYSTNSNIKIENLYNPENMFYINGGTHKVGEKVANELGIYDMCGNVAELLNESNATEIAICGGSWKKSEYECIPNISEIIMFYGDLNKKNYSNDIGFRVVRGE